LADLAVIVVNWNTRDLLRRCLDSVAENTGSLKVQVIVVDNGSHDGSQEMLRSDYPGITRIENTTNVGFARANNQGAACASAPLLLLLNSDAAILPGTLRTAVAFMQAHPRVGIVGLQLLNDDLSLQPSGGRFPALASTMVSLLPIPRTWRLRYEECRSPRDYSRVTYIDAVSGAALIVRRHLFEELGGFDEAFHFFCEDIDLCWRAKESGRAVAYLPSAEVVHSWGAARSHTPRIRQGLMSQRAQYLLLQRHKPTWQAMVLRSYLIAFSLARMVRAAAQAIRYRTPATHVNAHLYARELLWLLWR
jgi:GT2 family glycosyltransferase